MVFVVLCYGLSLSYAMFFHCPLYFALTERLGVSRL